MFSEHKSFASTSGSFDESPWVACKELQGLHLEVPEFKVEHWGRRLLIVHVDNLQELEIYERFHVFTVSGAWWNKHPKRVIWQASHSVDGVDLGTDCQGSSQSSEG